MSPGDFLMETNALHASFKQFEAEHPNRFKTKGIFRCGHCNGTGLNLRDKERPCEHCVSVGYVGFKEIEDETICPDCNGTGRCLEYNNHVTDCKTCDGYGRLDWIQAIQNGVRMDKIW